MNRIEQFGNHHVHTVLNTLNENIKIYPTDDLEVARIKKIISYIKQYLQLIDPELLNDTHITQLAQIQAQINNCIAYINQESKTQSVKHIEIAISHVLTLPITVKTAKQSIVGIMRAYNDSIKEGLEQIDLESTKQSAEKIKELEQKIFTSFEDEKGVVDLIDEKYKCIKDSHTKINKYYKNVFGFENEDSEITIGLKEELEKRKEQLDSLEKNYKDKLEEIESGHKAKYESLQNEIKSLLPDATSAGLATAYVAESVKFDDAIKVWNGVFIFSIIIMCVMYSLLSYYSVSQEKTSLNIMVSFIIRLPYLLPFIWLGFYAG
jgi:hypothetical protein